MRHPVGRDHLVDRAADDVGNALDKLEVRDSRAHVELLSTGVYAILHHLVSQALQPARGGGVGVTQEILGGQGHSDPLPTQVLIPNQPLHVFHGVRVFIRHNSASTRAGAGGAGAKCIFFKQTIL